MLRAVETEQRRDVPAAAVLDAMQFRELRASEHFGSLAWRSGAVGSNNNVCTPDDKLGVTCCGNMHCPFIGGVCCAGGGHCCPSTAQCLDGAYVFAAPFACAVSRAHLMVVRVVDLAGRRGVTSQPPACPTSLLWAPRNRSVALLSALLLGLMPVLQAQAVSEAIAAAQAQALHNLQEAQRRADAAAAAPAAHAAAANATAGSEPAPTPVSTAAPAANATNASAAASLALEDAQLTGATAAAAAALAASGGMPVRGDARSCLARVLCAQRWLSRPPLSCAARSCTRPTWPR